MKAVADGVEKIKQGLKDAAWILGICHKPLVDKMRQWYLAAGRVRSSLVMAPAGADDEAAMRKQWVSLWLALALLLAPFAAFAQQEGSGKTKASDKVLMARSGNDSKELRIPIADDAGYLIGPEDVLNISVWKEPDITQRVLVRPDGKISLPLVNDVQAAGLTPRQLASSVTIGLRKYLADPQVTVVVTQINSQRIYVLGEVTRAGTYPLLPNVTVLQALSSAGGFTQFANTNKICVLRDEAGKQVKFLFSYKDVLRGRRPEQNILLRAGDTIVVP